MKKCLRRYLLPIFTFCLIYTASVSCFANASEVQFSAFTFKDSLYVTFLSDSCNSYYGILDVSETCHADRPIKNYATTCSAELHIGSTQMICSNETLIPRVIEINLTNSKVAPEAKLLRLTYGKNLVEVLLNRDR